MTGERAEVLSSRGAVYTPHVWSPYKSFGSGSHCLATRQGTFCSVQKNVQVIQKASLSWKADSYWQRWPRKCLLYDTHRYITFFTKSCTWRYLHPAYKRCGQNHLLNLVTDGRIMAVVWNMWGCEMDWCLLSVMRLNGTLVWNTMTGTGVGISWPAECYLEPHGWVASAHTLLSLT